MSPSFSRRLPLAGAALSIALALGACGGSDPGAMATAASAGPAADSTAHAVTPAEAAPAPAAAAPVPTTTAPAKAAPPTAPRAKATTPTAPPTTAATAAAPATTAPAAVTPKFTPGQRINPTSAQVQTAIATLSQRIPLFKPTEPQLRSFADAACTSFDQGQTQAQVQATVQQAVTYVQGASLSTADAAFAVKTVVELRCPGYLG